CLLIFFFFFSSRRRHTRFSRDWSSDVCSSDLGLRIHLVSPRKKFVPALPELRKWKCLICGMLQLLHSDHVDSGICDPLPFFKLRSEERRVGKEYRSWVAPEH